MARRMSVSPGHERCSLEVRVHIVTGAVSAAQNIVKCIRRCASRCRNSCCSPWPPPWLCSPMMSVTRCGPGRHRWGTTDIAIFAGAHRHTAVIPIAGIRSPTTLPWPFARPPRTPRRSSVAMGWPSRPWSTPPQALRCLALATAAADVSQQSLAAVIEPRVEELFSLVSQVIRESALRSCSLAVWCSRGAVRNCPAWWSSAKTFS